MNTENIKQVLELTLIMGSIIRQLDENNEYSEFWTQDGDYIADSRFTQVEKQLKGE